jgi:hypothetical protein
MALRRFGGFGKVSSGPQYGDVVGQDVEQIPGRDAAAMVAEMRPPSDDDVR